MIQGVRNVEATEGQERRCCAGCFAPDTLEAPLPYELDYSLAGLPADLYCEACYQVFRTFHEEAEEAIIAALKRAKLHGVYTARHLRAALESLADCEEGEFAQRLERGTATRLRPRSVAPKPS